MSSPVTGSDFIIGSQNQSLCERLTSLLGLTSKVKLWFDWAFDETSGEATTEFKAMFLPPPGTIMAYYLKAPESTVKASVMRLGRSSSDEGNPFWVLCDGDAAYGAPDLRGRTIVGGGQGAGLANRQVDGSVFGSESATIGTANIPTKQHYHGFGDFLRPSDSIDDDFALLKRTWSSSTQFQASTIIGREFGGETVRNSGKLGTTDAIEVDTTDAQTVTPISIIPPAMALWYIMRTDRQA